MAAGSQAFNIPVNVEKGRGYALQYTTDFSSWHSVQHLVAISGRVTFSDFMEEPQSKRFYRIIESDGLPPENDFFSRRIALSGFPASATGNNTLATSEASEPNHAGSLSHSVWWSWTSSENTTVTISTSGSDYDTVLAVYTGTSISTLALVAQNDDGDSIGLQSSVRIPVSSETTYQIAVDGFSIATGNVVISITP